MKKFCNKLSKQQWRVSVPTLNTNLFRRSQSKEAEDPESKKPQKPPKKRVSSGCYDLDQAERAFDRSLSDPDAIYAETEVSSDTSTSSEDEDCFEDARTNSDKRSTETLYATTNNQNLPTSTNVTDNNAQFTYDVPKISFSFFDARNRAPKVQPECSDIQPSDHEDYDVVVSSKPVHKSELKIVLTSPESSEGSNKSSSIYEDTEDPDSFSVQEESLFQAVAQELQSLEKASSQHFETSDGSQGLPQDFKHLEDSPGNLNSSQKHLGDSQQCLRDSQQYPRDSLRDLEGSLEEQLTDACKKCPKSSQGFKANPEASQRNIGGSKQNLGDLKQNLEGSKQNLVGSRQNLEGSPQQELGSPHEKKQKLKGFQQLHKASKQDPESSQGFKANPEVSQRNLGGSQQQKEELKGVQHMTDASKQSSKPSANHEIVQCNLKDSKQDLEASKQNFEGSHLNLENSKQDLQNSQKSLEGFKQDPEDSHLDLNGSPRDNEASPHELNSQRKIEASPCELKHNSVQEHQVLVGKRSKNSQSCHNFEDPQQRVIIKCGSDPNLRLNPPPGDDDGLYKVPKSLQRNRLSMSLNDFDPEQIETISSVHSSIEHISCSQTIVQEPQKDEYCKARSKLPIRLRRVTFLRKPRSKAADTWTSLKAKMSEMMANEGGSKPGQLSERDKLAVNIEEMYRHSKSKCKKVLRSTGKMFRKKDADSASEKGDEGGRKEGLVIEHSVVGEREDEAVYSKIVKNDAFFERVDSANGSDSFDSFNGSEVAKKAEKRDDFDFATIKSAFRRSKFFGEGQNGFDDIRRYVKQGGDFCKELSVILQERSEAELQYAKSLSKLGGKLSKACREGVGDLNEAWRSVALELEDRAEAHRILGTKILEEAARPLRTLNENQHRIRKQAETSVDKTARSLGDWRTAEAKSKKHSHACARDNEKLQDSIYENSRLPRSTSLIHLSHLQKTSTDKENAKLEGKKKKAEDAVKKADIEYYTLCVRAERARLEWESSVWKSSDTFQSLEDERLNNLKAVLSAYLRHNKDLGPKLIDSTDSLRIPVMDAEPTKDLSTFVNLRQSSQQASEQLLPDFYCEHITLAMNRERRKQALVKLLQLIRQDIDRERKSKVGLENLSKAIKQTPNFGAEDSQQSVTEKLYHMKSMLTYLEGARYKLQNALAELDSRPRTGHPLAPHITITRDKSGLQQSVLKVPQWLREQYVEPDPEKRSPLSEKSDRSGALRIQEPDWNDRGTADGNSNQHDSDFDEFSSQGSLPDASTCGPEENPVQPISQCRALYAYTPNLPDELTLQPGDILSVYRQQEDGWWLGECNGSVGIFPATYVETIPTELKTPTIC